MVSSNDTAERSLSREATLYCPNCKQANRINGGWILHVHADSLEYECPDCGTALDSRRAESALTTQSNGANRLGPAE